MHLHPNNFMVCSGLAGGLISGFHSRSLGFSALWDYCHALFIIRCLLIVHVFLQLELHESTRAVL